MYMLVLGIAIAACALGSGLLILGKFSSNRR